MHISLSLSIYIYIFIYADRADAKQPHIYVYICIFVCIYMCTHMYTCTYCHVSLVGFSCIFLSHWFSSRTYSYIYLLVSCCAPMAHAYRFNRRTRISLQSSLHSRQFPMVSFSFGLSTDSPNTPPYLLCVLFPQLVFCPSCAEL